MPLDQVRKSLWMPDGERPLTEKDVIPLTQGELITLARMHEFAQKYGISIICKRCDTAIGGKNSGHDQTPSVACRCREWRFKR